MLDQSPAGDRIPARPRQLTNLLRCEAGNVAMYLALSMPVFLGAAGLAVDATSWYTTKRSVQNGVDAAAYAGALSLASQGLAHSPDLTAIQAAADDAASRNGLATPVTLSLPGGSQVEVTATGEGATPFTGMFFASAPAIPARAVAKAVVADACVWALHPSAKGALTVSGSAGVDLDCGVVVNSSHPDAAIDQGGTSCLSATSITVAGGYSGSCVSPDPEVLSPNYGDPLSSLVEPVVGSCDHNAKVNVSSGSSAILTPGVYCKGVSINGDVVFEPGLYIMDGVGMDIQSNAIVTNNEDAFGGVTFYLTGSGSKYADVSISSGSQITLTPMTSGPLANVLFFQDRDAKNAQSKFTGQSQMDLTGIIYFPSSEVEFAGGSALDEADILLVASTLKMSGSSYLNADYAKNVLPQSHYVRLVE